MQDRGEGQGPRPREKAAEGDTSSGATEDQVRMSLTVAQRVDREGTKLEDLAGTGDHDAKGG